MTSPNNTTSPTEAVEALREKIREAEMFHARDESEWCLPLSTLRALAAMPSAGRVEELERALNSICRETGRNADGLIDWQRCVDRIQKIARSALSSTTLSEKAEG